MSVLCVQMVNSGCCNELGQIRWPGENKGALKLEEYFQCVQESLYFTVVLGNITVILGQVRQPQNQRKTQIKTENAKKKKRALNALEVFSRVISTLTPFFLFTDREGLPKSSFWIKYLHWIKL